MDNECKGANLKGRQFENLNTSYSVAKKRPLSPSLKVCGHSVQNTGRKPAPSTGTYPRLIIMRSTEWRGEDGSDGSILWAGSRSLSWYFGYGGKNTLDQNEIWRLLYKLEKKAMLEITFLCFYASVNLHQRKEQFNNIYQQTNSINSVQFTNKITLSRGRKTREMEFRRCDRNSDDKVR